jgi:hypothetical protein
VTDTITDLVARCRAAKKAYDDQYKKMWATGHYNGRYQRKASGLYKELKRLEDQLLKAVYA